MSKKEEKLQAFSRLLDIMDDLRRKCPWDKKQTLQSLRYLTIEETYELADAIIENDLQEIKKELGDLLLHIVFYAKIASETNHFDITDVINGICEKLIHRHPHIYSDTKAETEKEVKQNWEKLKLKEGRKSVLEGVPRSLPAMVKAIRIQEKVKAVGFDWENSQQVLDKVYEELDELQREIDNNDSEKTTQEFGDLLFSVINYARFLEVNPEDALEQTNRKFIKRFQYLEEKANQIQKPLSEMTLTEMDVYWNQAKEI